MKKILTTFLFSFSFFLSYSQIEIDPLSNQSSDKFEYIELKSITDVSDNKRLHFLRTGKVEENTQDLKFEKFYTGDNKPESDIQVVNLLGQYGWEIISRNLDKNHITITLLKRKVK